LSKQYQELARAFQEQSQELAQLRAAAYPSGAAENANRPIAPSGLPDPLKEPFYPVSAEQSAKLGESCVVRVDQPALLESTPGLVGEEAAAMHAQPEEVAIMNRLMSDLHRELRSHLARLYEEALGHPASRELASRALLSEIQDKSPEGEPERIQSAVARERAGQAQPPSEVEHLSPYERAERAYLALGDDFQTRLAQEIGPERAEALRAAQGGWPWKRSQFSGCKQ
jgi:hypothetical protein